MVTYPCRVSWLRVVIPLTFALLLAACSASAGGITTATPPVPSTPAPTPALPVIAPTYDTRAHATTTATPFVITVPPAPACPTPISATLAAGMIAPDNSARIATATALTIPGHATAATGQIAGGTAAPVITATAITCNGATGPPTATALAGRLTPAPVLLPPTRLNPPPTAGIMGGSAPILTATAPGGVPATYTAVPTGQGTPGTGPVPPTATATATPGNKPFLTATATRVGVPARFAPITFFVQNGKDEGAGIMGVTPHNPTAPPGQPTYDEAELRAFVLANPPAGGNISISAAPGYTVTRITRTTLGAFDLAFGFPYQPTGGRSPDTLVYVVELAGQFTMSGGPAPGVSITFPMCVEVFDARTGDIYLEGGFER